MEQKNLIRNAARQAVRGMSPERKAAEAQQLLQLLCGLDSWRSARCAGLYSSLPDEVPSGAIIAAAVEAGKRVALPVVDGRDMYFRFFDPARPLVRGAFGIMEPAGGICAPEQIDFLLVPGVAFDPEGGRLGRGGGYYDRFLSSFGGFRAGICFSCQLFGSIPRMEHDQGVDTVLHAGHTIL